MRGKSMFAVAASAAFVLTLAQQAIPQTAQGGVTVVRQVVCTSIADKEPVGAADTFSRSSGNLACFTELKLEGSSVMLHKWYRADSLIGNPIVLKATGPRYRTYSRKMIPEWASGSWRVDVVDSTSGTVLSTKAFAVK